MPPPTIPDYSIQARLGAGNGATVYLALQESRARRIALKVMFANSATDPDYDERFMREAHLAASLSHPSIQSIFDLGEYEDRYYIAMEYHSGGSLKDRLKKNMTSKRAMVITRQLASALDYAQNRGITHGDIKPNNILFRDDGGAVLTDFGIARLGATGGRETLPNAMVGTPEYMSPEQARGHQLDTRSDLYSLGIVFYEMLAGNPPYRGSDAVDISIQHVKNPIPELPEALAPLQPVIDKLLAKSADDRYALAKDLISDLDALRMGAIKNRKLAPETGDAQKEEESTGTPDRPAAPPPSLPDEPTPEKRSRPTSLKLPLAKLAYLLVPAGLAAGLYYAHSNGYWESVTSHPAYQSSSETVRGWFAGLQGSGPGDAKDHGVDPTAVEESLSELAAGSIGTAINVQSYPGKINDSGISSRAVIALADIQLQTLPRIDKQTEIINEMLTRAATLRGSGHILSPPEDNALEAYREVLALDENNSAAMSGIEAITLGVINDLSDAIADDSLDEAQKILGRARAAELEDSQIDIAQARLDDAVAAEQARTAAAAAAKKERLIAEERARAAAVAASVAAATAAAATAAASTPTATPAAEAAAEAGVTATREPETPTVVQAPATPVPTAAPADRADALLSRFKITGLLKKAEFDIAEGRYTFPVGNNALQKYREVLRLTPGNQAAEQGIADLTETIIAELDAAIAKGDETQAALRLVELKQISPQNPRLLEAESAGL